MMYYSKYNKYKKKYLELYNSQYGGNNILLEYNSIRDDITFKIKSLELHIEFDFVPQFVNDLCNKNIFVLFNTTLDIQKFCEIIKQQFDISENITIDNNKFSFIYKNFSIKFIKSVSITFAKFYLSYNEIGLLLKIILKKYNFILKSNNLSINKFDTNIILTTNPILFCDFINIDYDFWERQIKSEEDIFMLIKSCRYYKDEIFTSPNYYFKNFKDKKILQNFFNYNKINLICLIKKIENNINPEKNEIVSIIKAKDEVNLAICYFEKNLEILNARKKYILDKLKRSKNILIQSKFNKIFLDPKFQCYKRQLSTIIKTLKDDFGLNYEKWILNSSQEEIITKINEIIVNL